MRFYIRVLEKGLEPVPLQAVSSVMSPTKNLIVIKFMKIFGCIRTLKVNGHFHQSLVQNRYLSTESRSHRGCFLS